MRCEDLQCLLLVLIDAWIHKKRCFESGNLSKALKNHKDAMSSHDPFLEEIQGEVYIFFAGTPPLYIFLAVLKIAWGLGKRCGSLGKIHPLPP